jgi:hypothetical protein
VQGRYDEAEPRLQRALAIFEDRLGPEHPHTRQGRANYEAMKRARDAEA